MCRMTLICDRLHFLLGRPGANISTAWIRGLLQYVSTVTASLSQSRMPKRPAIVVPVLKKSGLNTADMANSRPVSDVRFMSKVVERVVAHRFYTNIWRLMIRYLVTSQRTAVITPPRQRRCV